MTTTFLKHFNSVADPCIERCKQHYLLDIILLTISAVLSGAEDLDGIAYLHHGMRH